jgi:effector-binding domain-containing protein
MTSPVAMSLEDSMTMRFMVPRNIKKEDLPKPNNSNIIFEEIPSKKVAAIRFGGWASTEKIDMYQIKLKEALSKEGILHTDKFQYFGYNPPYELINRRNEVVVELSEEP